MALCDFDVRITERTDPIFGISLREKLRRNEDS